ncbi:MAG TPA: carboxypeptidase regulatory-like domain-containing protein [Chryseosolibacter sp.]
MRKYLLFIVTLIACNSYGQFITNNGIAIANSALLTTNGEWTNASGTNIINHGTIRTSESFTNNGTLDASSTGGFVLQFASTKNFLPGGSRMGFLTKEGAGHVMLMGTVGVRDSLMLRNGLIQFANATDTLVVAGNALVIASINSYVEGLVARTGAGNLLFPLGVDGNYLPLTMNKVAAKKLTAAVQAAPADHTAGPGVEALIGFPYAWKVSEQLDTDTAAYVEVNYPTTLPVVANPIVVREVSGQQFASMGARVITTNAGRATVRSYSRGTKGLFSLGQGFPGDFVTDSLALVALYNATGGTLPSPQGWTTKTNWLQTNVDSWHGITVTGRSITQVNLPANNLTGDVPDHLVDILSLQSVNLSGNAIATIPVFTENPEINSLNVTDNRLTFASLEPNAAVLGLNYLTQANFGTARDESVPVGSPVTLEANAGGAGSVYQWKRNGSNVPDATSPVYNLAAIGRNTMGEYVAEVTNPSLPGLVLQSATMKVLAHANVDGKLYIDEQTPASAGSMTLFKVTDTKFDVVETVVVGNDGTYTFANVTLDDYQIRGFADTLVYANALPTYYESTIFWEEADTLFLEDNVSNLDIYSVMEPGPPSGKGIINGTFEEDIPEGSGGRIKLPSPVRKAGVSARRVQATGRGQEEVLILVAYVFTNDKGEFTLPNLPNGTYRLTFEYPGYPMDKNSDVTIVIGDGLQSQVTVDAKVIDGKINVKKRIITGLFDSEKFHVGLFPNPAIDYINLYFDSEEQGRSVDLTSLNGRKLIHQLAEGKEARVNIQSVERGIYLLRVKQGGITVKTLKVVIE